MILRELSILNYKNIREADLTFSDKINCFVGLNGQGKTNLLDAIYLLSFTKSAFNVIDSQNITHDADMALVQGHYQLPTVNCQLSTIHVSCGLKRGAKKQFRLDKTDYKRLIDHIGLIPLVIVSPEDSQLIAEGSDERRRFLNVVIAQQDKTYLEHLTSYNALLKQRNALLKQYAEQTDIPWDLFDVLEAQMVPLAEYIFQKRSEFILSFVPIFQSLYNEIAGGNETVSLRYVSQLQDRDLQQAYLKTRQRDLILGWTSQGVHKDELEMLLDTYPLKRVGSQGQQKTYLLAMKLAQALYLSHTPSVNEASGPYSISEQSEQSLLHTPILLLDDIFDKLDSERVERIITLVRSDRFGQIFITDTDRQHLTQLLGNTDARIFHVEKGIIQ
ncbi:MAG: DNA replication and repair protein RecF [Paludibacteraceae bacterium]|nr:DNA replication and repair protein RecF [Paludibacteraceae bacterium]